MSADAANGPPRAGGAAEEDLSGTCAGAYVLQRVLARGGMGDVYLATARDRSASHAFAVKVLRRGLDSEEFVRRLQREQAMLAALRHPGIVDLRAAGWLADGRPFLVTTYLDGTHLDEHCHGLDARRILAVVADVCDIVHTVHAHGSVHRDLKPTNILVTRAGRPVVLDFGVATQLAHTARQTTITIGGPPLTPYFASPELLAGAAASPRSDVFSLGIMLRDLLGSAAKTESRRWRRYCNRIVDRSTSFDPRDRHAGAGELARDLRAVLAGRRIGLAHAVLRFLRCHKVALVAAAAVSVSVAASFTIAVGESRRTQRANEEALSVSEFLVRLLDQADPAAQGAHVTLPDAWGRAEALIPLTFADKPSAEARVRMAYGRAYSQQREWQRAAVHLQRALDLLLVAPGSMPESVAWCREMLAACDAQR